MNRTNLIIVLAVLAVLAAAGYFFFAGNKTPSQPMPTSSQPTASSQSTPAPDTGLPAGQKPAGAAITIQNFAFNPATLTIKVGETVVWTNNDSVPHQIKSDTFNSSQLSKGQTFSFTFPAAGTFDYSCAIHPSMHGQIIVQ